MATHAASIAVEFVDPNRHSFAQEFSREDTLGAARELLLAHLRIGGDQLRIFFQVPTRVGQTKTQMLIAWEDELTFGELAFLWTKDMDARKQGMRTMSGKCHVPLFVHQYHHHHLLNQTCLELVVVVTTTAAAATALFHKIYPNGEQQIVYG